MFYNFNVFSPLYFFHFFLSDQNSTDLLHFFLHLRIQVGILSGQTEATVHVVFGEGLFARNFIK